MHISVPLTKEGLLADQYGKFAPASDMLADHPVRSFPIEIADVPAGTESLALTFVDFDSTPVCGFTWIHWLAANFPANTTLIGDDASRKDGHGFVQGKNSNAGRLVNGDPAIAKGYVGPQPPDQIHDYTLTVYALDTTLDLNEGYWLNEFRHAAKGHVLEKVSLELPSRAN